MWHCGTTLNSGENEMKKTYAKPVLVKKGNLSAITAENGPIIISGPVGL